MGSLLLSGGYLVTVDAEDRVFVGDLLLQDGRIRALGRPGSIPLPPQTQVVDVEGCIVAPGFVQSHVHLCQVLFRGSAEDLPLLEWLHKRIWPLEAAHTKETLRASAQLGIAELLLGGTTAALDMGTVQHTEQLFYAAREMGFRLTSGKAMMDQGAFPAGLRETTAGSIRRSEELAEQFHGADDGLLHYAWAPRFILSCSDQLLKTTAERARAHGCLIHTHSSENPGEVEAVRAATGKENLIALHERGISGADVVLAHCVWLSDEERALLRRTNTRVAHCPSTNLKLASGVAPIPELLADGVVVGIGADGAPCNNRLSAFSEMHLASLLQKPRLGAAAMPASTVLRMATLGGARLLGLDEEIGSLEVGKRADIVVVSTERPHLRPRTDPITMLVHAAETQDVRHVLVDGHFRVRERCLVGSDLQGILDESDRALDVVTAVLGEARPTWAL